MLLVQPWLPVGSSKAVITTSAKCEVVGGTTTKNLEIEPWKANGEPATAVPSTEMATWFQPPALYCVRFTVRPWHVRVTLGVWPRAMPGVAKRAMAANEVMASQERRRPSALRRRRSVVFMCEKRPPRGIRLG